MALTVGDTAPDFELTDQHGQTVTLAGFRGQKNVLVLFYPWAFSNVCGGELDDLQAHLTEVENDGNAVVPLSIDSKFALRAYADSKGYTFPLLADSWPHGKVAADYGVFHDGVGAAARGTFLVDTEGIIRWLVVNEISAARSLDDYRAALAGV